jgi:hypothetical protein
MYMQPKPDPLEGVDPLEDAVQDLIIDLCEILYKRGYRTVPIGGLMRLIGVNADHAAEHDTEIFTLDGDFELLLKAKQEEQNIPRSPPPGATLH